MIRLEEVEKRFGATVALAGVSFSIARGEVVGLVGPNGAGKTTALRVLTGFLRPDRGRITIDDVDVVTRRRATAGRVGYLPEGPPLYPDMRVDEYLRFRAALKGIARGEVSARVDEALERVDATDRRRTLIGRLSRGYRQRVGLADASARSAVLLSSHALAELEAVATRMVFLVAGKVVADGAVEEVKAQLGASSLEDAFIKAVSGSGSGSGS